MSNPPDLQRRNGPTRDARIYWAIQLLLDTGLRPGELLGLRIQDIELDTPIPSIWIRGKLENRGNRWRWQPGLKTGSKGIRRLALSTRGLRAVRELLAHDIPSEDNLLLPSRTGKGWSPNNFGRLWRAVRTAEFAAITPTQIRHRVATDVRNINGIEAAAALSLDSSARCADDESKRPHRSSDGAHGFDGHPGTVHTLDTCAPDLRSWTQMAEAICNGDPARRRDSRLVTNVLIRHFTDGRSPTQIAREINLSRSAISRIIGHATELLPAEPRAHIHREHAIPTRPH
ncbi:site-specific integrase [Nocardia niigatensis]|uniref:site-specific integrase n=1 Tax=Nocardia niigatensis TaxID=209249 RepID=UPI000592C23D|nr:site-specific integrase [Nocardia niigatensis]